LLKTIMKQETYYDKTFFPLSHSNSAASFTERFLYGSTNI
jgi:hypothetical protein